jgi:hypothetical protein
MQPFLHVANGSATTRLIEAADIPGHVSIWADPLHEGPVPEGLSDAELLAVRARYLAGPFPDPTNDLWAWRAAIQRHQTYEELVLWFEHDLFDQLNLIQLLTWIREHLPAAKPVTLVCIGSFPGRPAFKGLGELTPSEVASLLGDRQPVTGQQHALAERAWRAFRASAPGALDTLRHEDTSPLPFLKGAISRFLEEYPWQRDGLSRTERRLLELAEGGIRLLEAFPRMHQDETAYYVTDGSLASLAEELSRTSPALLTLDTGGAANGRALDGAVALTHSGRTALAGALDRAEVCGLDRWLGGVHLQPGAPAWRWDDAEQRVTQKPPHPSQ